MRRKGRVVLLALSFVFAVALHLTVSVAWKSSKSLPVKQHGTDNSFAQKKFVYLIQSPQPKLDANLAPNKDRDVVWITFKESAKKVKGVEMIINVNTSWTTGRNALLEYVLQQKIIPHKQPGYLYYIFLDEDILSTMYNSSQYEDFEKFLLDKRPSTGYMPRAAPWTVEARTKNSNYTYGLCHVDANIMAYHRYTIGTLIPYDSSNDNTSIYYSAYQSNMLACALYSTSRIGLNTVTPNLNGLVSGRVYKNYVRYRDFNPLKKYMETYFIASSPMSASFDVLNCKGGNNCPYRVCQEAVQVARIEKSWLEEHLNESHPYSRFLLSWRQVYKNALEYVYEGSPPHTVVFPQAKCKSTDNNYNTSNFISRIRIISGSLLKFMQ